MAQRNIFVLGLDDLNREILESLPGADQLFFHQLLTVAALQHGEEIPIEELLAEAQQQLERFEGRIDAIVGYWDFPVSSMAPILARRLDLRAAPLEAVLRCEHKYWSRRIQSDVVPQECPRFALADPHDPDAVPPRDVPFPYWLKPVKSFSSALAHRVEDAVGFARAVADIDEGIDRVGQPFDHVLSLAELPPEIAEAGGSVCVAEEERGGVQVTIEGYAVDDQVHIYGAFDSISFDDVPSFLRFQYPSSLSEPVTERMADVSRRIIAAIGLQPSTFNVEFFWDADAETLTLLEINPRHSQSHAKLIEAVDGVSNHEVMIDLALGRTPTLPHGEGAYQVAAKWFLKRFDDALVTRIPTAEEMAAIERDIDATTIDLVVAEGERLSELHDQDSYSYKLANIYIAAADTEELQDKFDRCVDALRFEFDA